MGDPLRTTGAKLDSLMMKGDPVQPARSKPFSHLVTGVVVRAFAAHERRRASSAAMNAARCSPRGSFDAMYILTEALLFLEEVLISVLVY